jgi:guanine deaminase
MPRPLHVRSFGRVACVVVALVVVIPAVAISPGLWAARTSELDSLDQGKLPKTNRAVSEKVWVTAGEVEARFPAAKHREFMRRAVANSRMAGVEKRTGGAFGAVIVDSAGRVVADGSNHVVSNFDPTWHGEMEAIRTACARLKALKLDGCLLYTSAEPCPMCLAAAYWAGLDGIVFAANVADSKQYGGFDDAFIYEQFAKPVEDRSVPQIQMLRDEAVKVWKEYAALPDQVPY